MVQFYKRFQEDKRSLKGAHFFLCITNVRIPSMLAHFSLAEAQCWGLGWNQHQIEGRMYHLCCEYWYLVEGNSSCSCIYEVEPSLLGAVRWSDMLLKPSGSSVNTLLAASPLQHSCSFLWLNLNLIRSREKNVANFVRAVLLLQTAIKCNATLPASGVF